MRKAARAARSNRSSGRSTPEVTEESQVGLEATTKKEPPAVAPKPARKSPPPVAAKPAASPGKDHTLLEELHRRWATAMDVAAAAENVVAEDLFDRYDRNSNGKLSRAEFCDSIPLLELDMTSEQVDRLFEFIDVDKDGFLEANEFCFAAKYHHDSLQASPVGPWVYAACPRSCPLPSPPWFSSLALQYTARRHSNGLSCDLALALQPLADILRNVTSYRSRKSSRRSTSSSTVGACLAA